MFAGLSMASGMEWETVVGADPGTPRADGTDDQAEGLPLPILVRGLGTPVCADHGVLGRSACSGRSACRHCSRFGSPGPRSSQRTSLSLSLMRPPTLSSD